MLNYFPRDKARESREFVRQLFFLSLTAVREFRESILLMIFIKKIISVTCCFPPLSRTKANRHF